MPMAVEEVLYSAMEDYYIDIMIGAGETSRSVHLELPPFTLVVQPHEQVCCQIH